MDPVTQAHANYLTAKNALVTAVISKDKDGIKTAYIARKRAMAEKISLTQQANAKNKDLLE